MGKIKLNLVSGAVVEKPLISAFKANNSNYVVLDNEMTGSMGLPIILVCKFEGNKLIKIVDANEWGIVKEYLKNIIAGNQVEFIKINEELVADDIYYTQLTLPVPSYDALKNTYKVEEVSLINNDVNQDVMNNYNYVTSETTIQTPEQSVFQTPIMPEPVNNQYESPITDIPVNPMAEETSIDIVTPVMPNMEIDSQPVIEPTMKPISNENDLFKDQKEAFMQACENMFDALVQKFEKELENRK